ncbi:MAG: archaeosortase/exosortase family protein [Phycisphaerales bacterium]|nr:MAG: archaeosortase/exosortase family protein [Phycisphaerales bacterium]
MTRTKKPSQKGPKSNGGALRSRVIGQRPILRFVIILLVLLGAFNYLYYVAFVKEGHLQPYLAAVAEATGAVLRLFGTEARVHGTSVSSSRFALGVDNGCDALQAVAFFVFAVIASPLRASLLMRIGSIVLGSVLLLVINVIRIVSLYYVGAYWPSALDTMHIDVWQTIFIFLPILLWLFWVWWVLRLTKKTGDVNI